MPVPLLYFTFANQADNHLPLLREELDQIKDILRPAESRGFIRVEREESTRTADIIKTLAAFPDQIAVFHYSGHAGHHLLELEDGPAQSGGLAKLLGGQKNLVLVFLNGCSTKGQVEQLLKAGVKAVIATSVPIQDDKASLFATAFYRALSNKRGISRAFQFAAASLETARSGIPEPQIFRGFDLSAGEPEEILPWGLYIPAAHFDETANWSLPYYREIGLPADMISYINQRLHLNKYIVLVLDEMCRYNKDIYSQMVEIREGNEEKKDSSTYLDLVIQNFPWVIGAQLQLLRQHNKADSGRLEQLLSVYVSLAMTLYYILLSDCWDEKRELRFPVGNGFNKNLLPGKENIREFDFFATMLDIYRLMTEMDASFFMPETVRFCQQLEDKNTHAAKAWAFFEKLKKNFEQAANQDIEKLCLSAEQALAILLKEAAFLADYKMLTVRNISIDYPRHAKEVYELKLGALNAIVSTSLSLYEDVDKRRKSSYANCNSVILAPSEKDMRQTLNLSPFIIDKNAFLNNDHIDAFFFTYEDQGRYYYLTTNHGFFQALDNEKGTDIIDTSLTMADFEEGANITRNSGGGDSFGFEDAFGLPGATPALKDSPKAFALLETQFEQLKTDFNL